MKRIVHTDNAPAAIGPYSQATIHDGVVYCSGQIGLVPGTGEFVGDDVESQAKQVMKNLKAVLNEAGTDFDKVLKCSIFWLIWMILPPSMKFMANTFLKIHPPERR